VQCFTLTQQVPTPVHACILAFAARKLTAHAVVCITWCMVRYSSDELQHSFSFPEASDCGGVDSGTANHIPAVANPKFFVNRKLHRHRNIVIVDFAGGWTDTYGTPRTPKPSARVHSSERYVSCARCSLPPS
jgi:hypothetical protein